MCCSRSALALPGSRTLGTGCSSCSNCLAIGSVPAPGCCPWGDPHTHQPPVHQGTGCFSSQDGWFKGNSLLAHAAVMALVTDTAMAIGGHLAAPSRGPALGSSAGMPCAWLCPLLVPKSLPRIQTCLWGLDSHSLPVSCGAEAASPSHCPHPTWLIQGHLPGSDASVSFPGSSTRMGSTELRST